ncbi:MAG: hypothetical protein QOG15_2472, partial [Solirubrobacteraceae bacterium]|nr:hypothetical protein [Solirubrobacteraceae bacterium]
MHHKRRLLIALVVTGALTAGLGSFAATASAQMHTYKIVLLGGITTTVTLPEGVAPTSSLLGIGNLPILSITDITPTTTTPGAPTTTVPTGPTADAPSAGGSSDQSPTAKKSGKSSKSGADLARGILNHASVDRNAPAKTPMRNANGIPTLSNPTTSLAFPGPAPVGVPNFFINKYAIPPFLLSIYQAAGVQYGVRWEVLAAINEIETDYGRNLNVSSAGAMGWMQFIPSSWKRYGVDANQDG